MNEESIVFGQKLESVHKLESGHKLDPLVDSPPVPFEVKSGLSASSIKVLKFFLDRSKECPTCYFMGMDVVKRARIESGVVYPIMQRLAAAGLLVSKRTERTEMVKKSYQVFQITARGIQVAEEALAAFNTEMAYWRDNRVQKAGPEMFELLKEQIGYIDRPEAVDLSLTRELVDKMRRLVVKIKNGPK